MTRIKCRCKESVKKKVIKQRDLSFCQKTTLEDDDPM